MVRVTRMAPVCHAPRAIDLVEKNFPPNPCSFKFSFWCPLPGGITVPGGAHDMTATTSSPKAERKCPSTGSRRAEQRYQLKLRAAMTDETSVTPMIARPYQVT